MDYVGAKEAAAKWGITQRRVEVLCSTGRIQGVERIGRTWLIPKNADKPIDGRTKASKQHHKPLEYEQTLEIDHIIEMVNGTMAMEGLPLTEEDRLRLRTVMRMEETADEIVKRLVAKHRRHANAESIRV